jgi:hypothetical protein
MNEEEKINSVKLDTPISREITHQGHHFTFNMKALLKT